MFQDLDEATIAAIRANAPNVHNGTFTITAPDGSHFTIKLATAQRGELKGKRILGILIGPNNERDFQNVAFWNDRNLEANVWRRFKHPQTSYPINGYNFDAGRATWSAAEQKLSIWCSLAIMGIHDAGFAYLQGYRMQRASRCCVCNRKLTHPESLEFGIGPECSKKGTR